MPSDPLLLDIEACRAQFGQGRYWMMIDGNWQVAQLGNNEIKCDVNFQIRPRSRFFVRRQEGEQKLYVL